MAVEGDEVDKASELPPAKRQKAEDAAAEPEPPKADKVTPPPFGDDYVPADGGWFGHKGGEWLYNAEEKTFFHLPSGALHMDTDAGLISLTADAEETVETPEPEPVERKKGEVKWFNATKGFGFIEQDGDAKDLFVHRNQIVGAEGDPFACLENGAKVTFALGEADNGRPCAVQVQVESSSGEDAGDASAALDADGGEDGVMDDGEGSCASSGSSVEIDLEAELNSGTYTVKGVNKDHCEDFAVHHVKIPVSVMGETATCIFYGVYDGHGGFTCAEYAAAHLAKNVLARLRDRAKGASDEAHLITSLLGGFNLTEHNFIQRAKRTNDNSGSTACTMTVYGPDENMRLRLFLANIGDSRAVLGRVDGKAIRLTEDHKPELPAEKKRIEAQGGSVTSVKGVVRCLLPLKKRQDSGIVGLSVSRAFGDKEFKSPDIVSAEPDVTVHEVDWDGDEFVIIASDGIWDVVTDKMAVRLVHDSLRSGKNQDQASEALVRKALERGSKDDCTVVVVHFGWAKGAKMAATADGLVRAEGDADSDAEVKGAADDDEEADLDAGLSIAPRAAPPAADGSPAVESSADFDLFEEQEGAARAAQLAADIAAKELDDDDDDDDDDEYNLIGGTRRLEVPAASAEGPGAAASTESNVEASVPGLFDDLVPTREELAPFGPSLPAVHQGPSLPGQGPAGSDLDAQKPAAPAADGDFDMFG